MLYISNIARLLQAFLNDHCKESEDILDYRVFIRLNFQIEAFLLVADNADNILQPLQSKLNSYIQEELEDEEFDYKQYRIKFIVVKSSEKEQDAMYEGIFSASNNDKLDQGPRLRLGSILDKKEGFGDKFEKKCPIVSFYSYKGGMGRTTTMISYAMHLALKENKRVVIIDCDLEAPGYLNFFDLSNHRRLNNGEVNGLVEFLSDIQFAKDESSIDISDYYINVEDGTDDKFFEGLSNIYIMPAGNLNENEEDVYDTNRSQYLEGLSRLNLSNKQYAIHGFQKLINRIQEVISPDVILIDSRTGFNDIIGLVSLYMSDLVVGFFGYNAQTTPGLLSMLDLYYKNSFRLFIVSSILPKNEAENAELFNEEQNQIIKYCNLVYDKEDIPLMFPLRRNDVLETVGSSKSSIKSYVDIIERQSFTDYETIFSSINNIVFPVKNNLEQDHQQVLNDERLSADTPAIVLRNRILRNLDKTFSNIQSFAEQTQIDESTFFFRDCMNELFDDNKFIIRGYKGTGKTYLYKALADPKQKAIALKIKKRANEYRHKNGKPELSNEELKFIDIISVGGDEDNTKLFPFTELGIAKVLDAHFYFTRFWKIHTWNSILLDPEFIDIKEKSILHDYIKPINGSEAIKRYEDLIFGDITNMIAIEDDLKSINEHLKNNNTKLFILYDQLDTRINPIYWGKAVSPLINYWRENWNTYSNISPKLFIRTDLYKRIDGTNTARLEDNCISIEWTIEEVFAYFFKLIFSKQDSAQAMESIMVKTYTDKQYITYIKNCNQNNYRQIYPLNRPTLAPLVEIFFGEKVVVKGSNLGNSWNYFINELSNADSSISLRPFITILDKNAIKIALEKYPNRYVTELVSSEIYASREVRIKATNTYFNDLAQDDYSRDLLVFKEYLNSDKGKEFRLKTLKQELFDEMIQRICNEESDRLSVIKTENDLKTILYANGIIAEKPTRGGLVYRFAKMYWYAWGLSGTEIEDESATRPKVNPQSVTHPKGKLIGVLSVIKNKFKVIYDSIDYIIADFSDEEHFVEGAKVEFEFFEDQDWFNPSQSFWKADKVKVLQ